MSRKEEFDVIITPDGKIRLDFRGMKEESYRRILEVLQETVGPVEPLEAEAEQDSPPGVREVHGDGAKRNADKEKRLRQDRRS